MIKFLCASCQERLSVPDQFGGRKGLCPSCGGVNRVPLKGFAETQPDAPVTAKPLETPPPISPEAEYARQSGRGMISIPALSGRAEDPQPPIESPTADEIEIASDDLVVEPLPESEPIIEPDLPEPVASAPISSTTPSFGIFGLSPATPSQPAEREIVRPVEKESPQPIATIPQEPPASFGANDAHAPMARPERRLPKPVKIALLIITVLVIVGALYCALLFGIQFLTSHAGN